jgi:ribonucleotide reductase beta subunit family protein with ferritin-like domain
MWLKHEQVHWLHSEIDMAEDIKDFKQRLTAEEKEFLTKVLRFFVQGDIDIGGSYLDHYIPIFRQPEVRMMMSGFAARESLHVAAYAHLIESLDLPSSTYNEFLQYQEMVEKHEYLAKVKDMGVLEKIACVSAFGEGMQLFASFIMLLNFARNGKMRATGQIISWSIQDECVSGETEVLTPSGWRLVSELKSGDNVMQFDTATQLSSYQPIRNLTTVERDHSYLFEGENFHQHVTGGHRMITKKGDDIHSVYAQDCDPSSAEFVNEFRSKCVKKKFDKLNKHDKRHCKNFAEGKEDLSWLERKLAKVSSAWASEFFELLEKYKAERIQ